MEIARGIEPCSIGEARRINHQSVSLPATARIPHPELRAVQMSTSIHANVSEGMGIFRSDQGVVGAFENLEWKMKVHGSGNAGHEALRQRICLLCILRILGFLLRPFRRVRQSTAANQKLLDIGIRSVVSFPDSLQIWQSVRIPRRFVRLR